MTLKELIDSGRDLLTRKEAAELLLLKPNTLAVWATKGWYAKELPVVRLSRTAIRYRRLDVERFISSRSGNPIPPDLPTRSAGLVRSEAAASVATV